MNALEKEIRRRIELAGPMPVHQYMSLCLGDPAHGYYITRDPLGQGGDFITSPEISQMFGELVGLWAASTWQLMGEPENFRLVELGPGRGTMMLDILRTARVVPAFRAALVAHLVEISPALQRRQVRTLQEVDVPLHWHTSFNEVPPGPVVIVANEFFDALPVHQAVKQINGWYERVVQAGDNGELAFGIADAPIPSFDHILPRKLRDAPIGSVYEWRSDPLPFEIGRRIAREGGAALVIDYGHMESAVGETLQAVKGHAFTNTLKEPGEADLTAHVDFQALAISVESMAARVHGPITQAEFLRGLGIEQRAGALRAQAAPEKAQAIDAALRRLTAEGRGGMGRLFKVIGFGEAKLGPLPGFD